MAEGSHEAAGEIAMRRLKQLAAAATVLLLTATAGAAQEEQTVELTAVETAAQPMLYVTARSSMQPDEIRRVMDTAFATLGRFLGETQIVPLGPPVAVYSNWAGGQMTTDVGFPVAAADAARARGDVLAGTTPSGPALKAVHRGPYDGLAATYRAIEARMQGAGMAPSGKSWEIYLNEPGAVPDADLLTEIYMQVSAEDAAKLKAK